MKGYFVSFLVTHLINFLLSLRRLSIITGFPISFAVPALAASACLLAVWISRLVQLPAVYVLLLPLLLSLFGVLKKEDIAWMRQLVFSVTRRKKCTA